MRTLPLALRNTPHVTGSTGILLPVLLTSMTPPDPMRVTLDSVERDNVLLLGQDFRPDAIRYSTRGLTYLMLRECFSAYPQEDSDRLVRVMAEYLERHDSDREQEQPASRQKKVSEIYSVLMQSLWCHAYPQEKQGELHFLSILNDFFIENGRIPDDSQLSLLIDEAFRKSLASPQHKATPPHHFTFDLADALVTYLKTKAEKREEAERKAGNAALHDSLLRKGRSAVTLMRSGKHTARSEKRLLITALYCIFRHHLPECETAALSDLASMLIRHYAHSDQNVTLLNNLGALYQNKEENIDLIVLVQAIRMCGVPPTTIEQLKEILGDGASPQKLQRYTLQQLVSCTDELIKYAKSGEGEFPMKLTMPPEATKARHDDVRLALTRQRVQEYQSIKQAAKNVGRDLLHVLVPSRFAGAKETPEYQQNKLDRAYLLKQCVSAALPSAAHDAPHQQENHELAERIISILSDMPDVDAEDYLWNSISEHVVRMQHHYSCETARHRLDICKKKLRLQRAELEKDRQVLQKMLLPGAVHVDDSYHRSCIRHGEQMIKDCGREVNDAAKVLNAAKKGLKEFNGMATGLNFNKIASSKAADLSHTIGLAAKRSSRMQKFSLPAQSGQLTELLLALATFLEKAGTVASGGQKYAITAGRAKTLNNEANIREWMRYARATPSEMWKAWRAGLPSKSRIPEGGNAVIPQLNLNDEMTFKREALHQLSRLSGNASAETYDEVAANLMQLVSRYKGRSAGNSADSAQPQAGKVPQKAASGIALSSVIKSVREFLKTEATDSAWPLQGASGSITTPHYHCPEGTAKSMSGVCQPIINWGWDDMPININDDDDDTGWDDTKIDNKGQNKTQIKVNSLSLIENSKKVEAFQKEMKLKMPNIKQLADETLVELIKKRTGKTISADECWLSCYSNSMTSNTAFSGWVHYGKPRSSVRLNTFMYTNVNEMSRLQISENNIDCIITTKNPVTENIEENDILPLLPSNLLSDIYECDFYNMARESVKKYYQKEKPIVLLKLYNFISNLSQGLLPQKLRLDVLKGVGLMKGKEVSSYLLDINGYASSDACLFINNISQSVVLFLPRSKEVFHGFGNLDEMRNWIILKCKTEDGRNEISSHFSLHNQDDGFWRYGIKAWVNKISGEWLTSKNHIATNSKPISKKNFFKDSVTRDKDRALSDIDVAITSQSKQLFKDWEEAIDAANEFPNPFSLIASPVMHIVHAFNSETWEEEKNELKKIGSDIVNLAMMVALEKAPEWLSFDVDLVNGEQAIQLMREEIEKQAIEVNNERYAFNRVSELLFESNLAPEGEYYIETEDEGFIPVVWSPADEGYVEVNLSEGEVNGRKYSVYKRENGKFKKTEVVIEDEESLSCQRDTGKSTRLTKRTPKFPCLPSLSNLSRGLQSNIEHAVTESFESRKRTLTSKLDENATESIKRRTIEKQSDYLKGYNNYDKNLPELGYDLKDLDSLQLKKIAITQGENFEYIYNDKQFGALSRLIEAKLRVEHVASQVSLVQKVLVEWYKDKFEIIGLPQDNFIWAGLSLSDAGKCLPLRELMCLAFDIDKVDVYIREIWRLLEEPGSAEAEHFLDVLGKVHKHTGVSKASEILKKEGNPQGRYSITKIIDLIGKDFKLNEEIFLGIDSSGGEKGVSGHAMLIVKKNGKFTFYDPNFGIVTCDSLEDLEGILKKHLIKRGLADTYNAYKGKDGVYYFTVKKIDPKKIGRISVPYEDKRGGVTTTKYEKLSDIVSDQSKFQVDKSVQADMDDLIAVFFHNVNLDEEFEFIDKRILEYVTKEKKKGWDAKFWTYRDNTFIKSGSKYYNVLSQDGWSTVRLKKKGSSMPGVKLRYTEGKWSVDPSGLRGGGIALDNNAIRASVNALLFASDEEIDYYVEEIQEALGLDKASQARQRIDEIIRKPNEFAKLKDGKSASVTNEQINENALRSALGSNYIPTKPTGLQKKLHINYWAEIKPEQVANLQSNSFKKSNGRTFNELKKELPVLAEKIELASINKESSLKIYRGMSQSEYDLISSWAIDKLPKLNEMFADKSFGDLVQDYAIPIGNHAADIRQAMKYGDVLVEITLRKGVDDVMFTSDFLALAPLVSGKKLALISELIKAYYPEGNYEIASFSEGSKTGYIGIKREDNNFSFGFGGSKATRILLSIMIEEVKVIGRFKSGENNRIYNSEV